MTAQKILATFTFIGEIDEDENGEEDEWGDRPGIEYSTQVSLVDLCCDEIHGHQIELVFEDKTHCGIAWWRIHNYMLKTGIYTKIDPKFMDNEFLTEFFLDDLRHVRLLVKN